MKVHVLLTYLLRLSRCRLSFLIYIHNYWKCAKSFNIMRANNEMQEPLHSHFPKLQI